MITKNDTFSYIVSQNKSLTSVLERFGFGEKDYHKTIEQAAKESNTDPDFILEIVKAFDSDNNPDHKVLNRFPVETILKYLKSTHYYYLNKKIPEIELSLHDIIRRHHHGSTVLFALGNLFIVYKRKLAEHIEGEEKELFPYVEYLIQQLRSEYIDKKALEVLSGFNIQLFEDAHTNVEEDIAKTRETILKFSPEKTYAMSYRIFLNQLELFERDLHRHSIIEDEVLVPKAKMLEQLVRRMVLGFEK
jgi:regulator of cell morphogenesis and NO signaling